MLLELTVRGKLATSGIKITDNKYPLIQIINFNLKPED